MENYDDGGRRKEGPAFRAPSGRGERSLGPGAAEQCFDLGCIDVGSAVNGVLAALGPEAYLAAGTSDEGMGAEGLSAADLTTDGKAADSRDRMPAQQADRRKRTGIGAVSRQGSPGGDVLQGALRLLLTEVLNNIVEHAYDGQPGEVVVAHVVEAGKLRLRITDSGREMPDGRLPSGRGLPLSGPRASLPEGGFGWALIRQLSDGQHYDRDEGRNHLWLEVALGARRYRG